MIYINFIFKRNFLPNKAIIKICFWHPLICIYGIASNSISRPVLIKILSSHFLLRDAPRYLLEHRCPNEREGRRSRGLGQRSAVSGQWGRGAAAGGRGQWRPSTTCRGIPKSRRKITGMHIHETFHTQTILEVIIRFNIVTMGYLGTSCWTESFNTLNV